MVQGVLQVMHRLTRMKEFIYEIDGEFYQIGMCVFKKLNDSDGLVTLFKEYKAACNCVLLENKQTYDLEKSDRNNVATKFERLLNSAYVPIEERNISDEDREQFDDLIDKHSTGIDSQIELWLKADRCLFEKQVDELKSK